MKKRMTAMLLCLIMVLTSIPLPAVAASKQTEANTGTPSTASTASSATDTVYKIMLAIDKLGASTGGSFSNMTKEAEIWLRCSGIGVSMAGFAGAGVAILQMAGVIEDPTAKTLAQILTEIGNVQDQLQVINGKLDGISEQLIELSADEKEDQRQSDARKLLTNWRTFNTAYVEKVADLQEKYEGYINQGARDWWAKDHAAEGDKYLLYTHLETDNSVVFVYSRAEDNPAKPANKETIDTSLTIGIPAECMPETKNFRVSTYKKDFLNLYTSAIKKAADEGKLIVDESSAFYREWAGLSDKAKQEKANAYAEDLFALIMYEVACDVMTEQNQFVIDVRNAYTNYCKNIVEPDTGIDALINVLYVTHAFEGEVKDDIEKYCYGMVLQAGVYGEFAMSCASQSALQTDANLEELSNKWLDTVDTLFNKASESLHGKDNYCYITESVVEFKEAKASSTATVKWHIAWQGGLCLDKCTSTEWEIVDKNGKTYEPAILKDAYAKVLYRYYRSQKTGNESFGDFLYKNNVGIPKKYSKKIVTNVIGGEIFSLSDGLEMTCKAMNTPNENFGKLFKNGNKYRINKGNSSGVDGSCFVVHDQMWVNYINMEGTVKTNKPWAARAVYAEHDSMKSNDEVHIFYDGCSVFSESEQDGKKHTEVLTFSESLPLLVLTPVVKAALPGGGKRTPHDLYREKFRLEFPDPKKVTIPSGRTLTYNGKTQTGVKKGSYYRITRNTAKKAGTYTATISLIDRENYVWTDGTATNKTIKWKIKKAANPMKIGAKTISVRYSKLKKKALTLTATKVIWFKKKATDKKTYTLVSAKKGKKSIKKYFKIEKKTGKVTVKKGLKKGTYKVKVKVRAAGNANYKASAVKTVTFKIKVK